MTIFKNFEAPAGAGKTHVFTMEAARRASAGERVLIVQPTIALNAQTATMLEQHNFSGRVSVINGDTCAQPVNEFQDHLIVGGMEPQITITTHTTFEMCRYIHEKSTINLIVDELPKIESFVSLKLPKTHTVLTKHLSLTAVSNQESFLNIDDREAVETLARNESGDEWIQRLDGLPWRLLSEHCDTCVLSKPYEALLTGNGTQGRLIAHSILKPSAFQGFKDVILVGALINGSLLQRLWLNYGAEFEPASSLMKNLRYLQHQNGSLITIKYLTDRLWSKSFRDQPGVKKSFRNAVIKEFGSTPFAYMVNNDSDEVVPRFATSKRMSGLPSGLNEYQYLDNVVIFSALNLSKYHSGFLERRGLTQDEITTAVARSTTYQGIMRCSIRDPNNTRPKLVIVGDRMMAEWLSGLFPGSLVAKLDTDIDDRLPVKTGGRVRVYENNAERSKAFRVRKKLRRASY